MAKKRSRKSKPKEGSWPPPMQGQQDDDFEDPRNPDGWHPPMLAPKPKPEFWEDPGPWRPPEDPTFENTPLDPVPDYGAHPSPELRWWDPWPTPSNPIFGPLGEPEFWGDPGPPDPPKPDFTPLPGGYEDETIPDPQAQQTGPPRQRPRRKTKGPSKKAKSRSKSKRSRGRERGKGK